MCHSLASPVQRFSGYLLVAEDIWIASSSCKNGMLLLIRNSGSKLILRRRAFKLWLTRSAELPQCRFFLYGIVANNYASSTSCYDRTHRSAHASHGTLCGRRFLEIVRLHTNVLPSVTFTQKLKPHVYPRYVASFSLIDAITSVLPEQFWKYVASYVQLVPPSESESKVGSHPGSFRILRKSEAFQFTSPPSLY